jgi:plastocyanin
MLSVGYVPMRQWFTLAAVVGVLCTAAHLFAATKVIEAGPEGTLTFRDEESGSDTTTVMVGDTVEWRWMSSGHSTTRTDSPESWDSGVHAAPFTFSHTFETPGTFPYHCTPHEFLGMTGTVVVGGVAAGPTTTTTLPPPACRDADAVARIRAEIDSRCDCAGASTHRSYVRCAAAVAREAARAGTLPRACKGKVKTCAATSTCGRPGFVTCCRTIAGVQTCSVKRSAVCRAPRRGTACISDRPSCCDACGGATCPAPPPTTSTTTTTVAGAAPTTTTTPMPSRECASARCPDGTPAHWVGTASGFAGVAAIEFRLCAVDAFVFGTFTCLSGFPPGFAVGSPIGGTAVIGADGIAIVFAPVVFVTGDVCTFDAPFVDLTMGGGFTCVDPFGFILNDGTWSASRCP